MPSKLYYWAWVAKKSLDACRHVKRFTLGPSPIFYHCPSGLPRSGLTSHVRLQFHCLARRVTRARRVPRCSAPESVAFVTVSNYLRRQLIEKCFDARGIPCVTLGRDIRNFTFLDKVRTVLDYARSPACAADYIVANDARDVVMVAGVEPIVELFESCNCDVLMSNTNDDWPPHADYHRFEQDCCPRHPFHRHLNAGGYMARRQPLIEFLDQMLRDHQADPDRDCHYPGRYDDQLAWRRLHRQHYPRIKVDHRSLIFKRFDLFLDRD